LVPHLPVLEPLTPLSLVPVQRPDSFFLLSSHQLSFPRDAFFRTLESFFFSTAFLRFCMGSRGVFFDQLPFLSPLSPPLVRFTRSPFSPFRGFFFGSPVQPLTGVVTQVDRLGPRVPRPSVFFCPVRPLKPYIAVFSHLVSWPFPPKTTLALFLRPIGLALGSPVLLVTCWETLTFFPPGTRLSCASFARS